MQGNDLMTELGECLRSYLWMKWHVEKVWIEGRTLQIQLSRDIPPGHACIARSDGDAPRPRAQHADQEMMFSVQTNRWE